MTDGLWLDLLNSDWHDHRGSGRREDRLDDPLWLEKFLSGWKLDLAEVPPSRLAPRLRELRTVLRRIADKYATRQKAAAEDWNGLNGYLGRVSLVKRILVSGKKPEIALVPLGDKMEAALAAIVGSFAETIVQGDPSRLKVCQNRDCHWVFLDRSKNRSRRWCENTCGNLMKVRRFRRRLKALPVL